MQHITLYSAPDCEYCALAREYFVAQKLPFTEYDVSANREKWTEMIECSGQIGVPVIVVGTDVLIGFDRRRIEKTLGRREPRATISRTRRVKHK
ncbi:NrdH-redoxin [Patescibacteria group bacterium]|nr:NrdH-redoxin [Patescibacteria group bacterium]